MEHNFNEKAKEYSKKSGTEVAVWQSDKYKESRAKAVEMIESGKYGLNDGDFWILMNETKGGEKIAYTGLIISHNGCMKINDNLPPDKRFRPSCVVKDKDGYCGSLTYEYICDEQGIYEVGEVSPKNCKNDYLNCMALKRMIDRVVLKNSKLAYAGILSEAEADEFKEPIEERKVSKNEYTPHKIICERCNKEVETIVKADNEVMIPREVEKFSKENFGGKVYCEKCMKELKQEQKKSK